LEFGSKLEVEEEEAKEEAEPSPKPIEEYQLPQLKPPSLYAKCQDAL